ncbi:MAG: chromophore lyase CpcT/CpeT [Phycisphaerales bacterium]
MKHFLGIGTACTLVLSGCASTPSTSTDSRPTLERLERHLTGSFSSKTQATQDPEFFEIVLHMVPIWEDRADGPWLYVEQAVATSPDRPYRQRVYHLAQTGGNEFVSTVYSFEDPMEYAGAYADESALSDLDPDDLTVREGCAITMSWSSEENAFVGSTSGRDCVSNLRGSTYATSEVFLHMDRLITWDRGFDENDEQVWGAVKGGYIFDRAQ